MNDFTAGMTAKAKFGIAAEAGILLGFGGQYEDGTVETSVSHNVGNPFSVPINVTVVNKAGLELILTWPASGSKKS